MLVDACARPAEADWREAELALPTGPLLLPTVGGLMVISALVVSVAVVTPQVIYRSGLLSE
jgi:hypothetical protein